MYVLVAVLSSRRLLRTPVITQLSTPRLTTFPTTPLALPSAAVVTAPLGQLTIDATSILVNGPKKLISSTAHGSLDLTNLPKCATLILDYYILIAPEI
jgi:hypothetical protein